MLLRNSVDTDAAASPEETSCILSVCYCLSAVLWVLLLTPSLSFCQSPSLFVSASLSLTLSHVSDAVSASLSLCVSAASLCSLCLSVSPLFRLLPCVSLCLSVSGSFCLSVSLCFCLPWQSLTLPLCLSLCAAFASLSLSVSASLSLTLNASLYLCSFCLFVSVLLVPCLSLCLSVSLCSFCLPVSQCFCLSVS